MKRFLCIFLSILCCFSTLGFFSYANVEAESDLTLSVENAEDLRGEEVSVKILVTNNDLGFNALKLYVGYDSEVLELTAVKSGGEFEGNFQKGQHLTDNPYVMTWAGTDDTYDDVHMCTMTFKILDEAAYGDTSIELDVAQCINSYDEDVVCDVQNGKITVVKPVTGVELDKETLEIIEGDTFALSATVLPVDATHKDVVWESEDDSIATVDQNGNVTAVYRGETTVKVTTVEGGFTASCAVVVTCDHDFVENADENYIETAGDCCNKTEYYLSCSKCGEASDETFEGDYVADVHVGGEEIRNAAAPECIEPGYTGDTYCLGCDAKIGEGRDIDPTGIHLCESGEWDHNDNQHFHICDMCTGEFNHGYHTGGVADEHGMAICEICSASYSVVFLGDCNEDKEIDLRDATLLLKHIAEWDVEINLRNANVNGDTVVDLKDATLMLKYIAEWDVEFVPAEG